MVDKKVLDKLFKDLETDYHCSDSTAKAILEYYGKYNRDVIRASHAFSGGIGDTGNICGGPSGALMAISYLLTPEKPAKKPWTAGKEAKYFMEEFLKRNKLIDCKDIMRGLHWKEADQYCRESMRISVELAIEIIDKYKDQI